jgi:16S rRNA (uracil1498-N3)-methyltransferase
LYVGIDWPLSTGLVADLPTSAARHAQVLRMQPGDALQLFDGLGHEWAGRVLTIGRSSVTVAVGEPAPSGTELRTAVTLAVVMPANERMDTVVEKATELGAWCIVPLLSTRSVLRLSGERALKRQTHWHGVAVASCEQCGRAVVPLVAPVQDLTAWLLSQAEAMPGGQRLLMSFRDSARPLAQALVQAPGALTVLSGPEGGLTADEEALALKAGFTAISLGPRVLRADTAPLAVLAWLGLQWG